MTNTFLHKPDGPTGLLPWKKQRRRRREPAVTEARGRNRLGSGGELAPAGAKPSARPRPRMRSRLPAAPAVRGRFSPPGSGVSAAAPDLAKAVPGGQAAPGPAFPVRVVQARRRGACGAPQSGWPWLRGEAPAASGPAGSAGGAHARGPLSQPALSRSPEARALAALRVPGGCGAALWRSSMASRRSL